MIILGIDPGRTLIGYGVIEFKGVGVRCLEYGTITNPGRNAASDFQDTLMSIHKIVDKFQPERACVEKLFFSNNQKTAMAVSEMRGVIQLALAQKGVPVQEFTPLQVKQSICNYGKAEKKQVQQMVKMLLNISQPIKPDDAADALALALCGGTHPQLA